MTDSPRVIEEKSYRCSECGFETVDGQDFEPENYEAGSGGKRTVRCPACKQVLSGWPL